MLGKNLVQKKSDVFETNDIVQKANFAFNEIIGSVAANEISPNLGSSWSHEQKKEQFLTIDRF
jgi:hypothetical protein